VDSFRPNKISPVSEWEDCFRILREIFTWARKNCTFYSKQSGHSQEDGAILLNSRGHLFWVYIVLAMKRCSQPLRTIAPSSRDSNVLLISHQEVWLIWLILKGHLYLYMTIVKYFTKSLWRSYFNQTFCPPTCLILETCILDFNQLCKARVFLCNWRMIKCNPVTLLCFGDFISWMLQRSENIKSRINPSRLNLGQYDSLAEHFGQNNSALFALSFGRPAWIPG
jgi:hypothetical protein